MSRTYVQIEEKRLRVTNLDKVLYPAANFTKAHVIDYYRQIADFLLPHLRNRCITLKRYPDGVEGEFFYEKQCPSHRPEWVSVREEAGADEPEYCLLNDLASLIWAANLASIELHPLLSLADDLDRPTAMVFDLDPGPQRDILDCAAVAIGLHDMLSQMGLKTFVKVSGGKGLHLYAPLNTAVSFEDTKSFARAVALTYEKHYPQTTSKMNKKLRTGKVFIDWSQNDSHKTTVAVYSLRAMATPTVSMPLRWAEVRRAVRDKDRGGLFFTPDEAVDIAKKQGDIFRDVLELEQKLPIERRTQNARKKST